MQGQAWGAILFFFLNRTASSLPCTIEFQRCWRFFLLFFFNLQCNSEGLFMLLSCCEEKEAREKFFKSAPDQ